VHNAAQAKCKKFSLEHYLFLVSLREIKSRENSATQDNLLVTC
jgi:hypothetical protein